MRKLIEFIRSIYVVVLFVVLEVLAVSYYAHSSSYTQARLLARTNQVSGGLRSLFGGIRRYFLMGSENRVLLDRITQLEERLSRYEEVVASAHLDSCLQSIGESKYFYTVASVASNSINRQQNLITLNRGRNAGIQPDMSVLTPDGAMICWSSRSTAYWTGPLRHRYRSDPRVGCVSLTTSTTLPLASAMTRRKP